MFIIFPDFLLIFSEFFIGFQQVATTSYMGENSRSSLVA
jgi:hypothetical protein